jgi:hypothetical protein
MHAFTNVDRLPTKEQRQQVQALLRKQRSEQARALRDRAFAVYGLDATWHGTRWVGGWGASDGIVNRIDLAHGLAREDDAPLVRVETLHGMSIGHHWPARHIAMTLWHSGAEHDAVRGSFSRAEATASWVRSALPVEGHSAPCRILPTGAWWGALVEVSDGIVSVTCRNIAPKDIALAVVEDAEPNLSGAPSH